jgi:hypothetical protein
MMMSMSPPPTQQTLAMSVSYSNGNLASPSGTMQAAGGMGVSIGWQGEWALQGEGTKEGKRFLQELLKGSAAGLADESRKREWEVVRERCGGGRLWMR